MSDLSKKIFVALVPVVHTLYLDLFKKYPEHIYILGESILEDWDEYHKMGRDLRRIDQEQMKEFVSGLPFVKKVSVLEKSNLAELTQNSQLEIVMPKEDVSEWVNKTYFNNNKVEFENVFLRWNRPVSTQELEVAADRKISNDTFHKEMMARAEVLAEKSANWWRQIGVLAVRDGEIIAEAFNAHVPTQQNMAVYGDLRMCFDAGECHELSNSIHGEAALIARCAREGIQLKGADLFVTVYPCPTCAKLIAEAGINTVYYRQGYSLSDAEDILKAEGVEIILVK